MTTALRKHWQMVIALKQARSEDARALIAAMMSGIANRQLPLRAAELVFFNLVNTLIKTLLELGIESHNRFHDWVHKLATAEYETMEELESSIAELCQDMCVYMEEQTGHRNRGLTDKIMEYIEEQYADSMISLESIADHFALSPSYVTRVFKECTGYPLMRYIDRKRMEKVKELLKRTDTPIKDIIAEVGYNDPTNFIRKFKKCEGLTPIQYRNMLQ